MENKVYAKLTNEEIESAAKFHYGIKSIQDTIDDLIQKRSIIEKEKQEFIDTIKEKYNIPDGNWHFNLSSGTVREGHV